MPVHQPEISSHQPRVPFTMAVVHLKQRSCFHVFPQKPCSSRAHCEIRLCYAICRQTLYNSTSCFQNNEKENSYSNCTFSATYIQRCVECNFGCSCRAFSGPKQRAKGIYQRELLWVEGKKEIFDSSSKKRRGNKSLKSCRKRLNKF